MRIYGPYTRKDGRQHVILYFNDGTRQTMSYPKWLKQQELGKSLKDNEHVHHVDEDYTNDSLDNLQVLPNTVHAQLHNSGYGEIELICDYCKKPFKADCRKVSTITRSSRQSAKGPFCSRSCAGKGSHPHCK